MITVTKISDWQKLRRTFANKTVGFVPTMGHLHEGHLDLCQRAKAENDVTVVSIFINPSQFNQQADFDKYPRTIETDKKLLSECQVDYLFMPDADEMYPDNYEMKVTEVVIASEMEGHYRPGHFEGVMTIVLKLLNLVQPAHAYFGEKDYQQLLLIEKMAQSFFLPTKIVGCKTIRADDGLALSSRNSRLAPDQRKLAACFPAMLKKNLSVTDIAALLNEAGFIVDYVCDKWNRRLAAVWLGDVRLIDNITLENEHAAMP